MSIGTYDPDDEMMKVKRPAWMTPKKGTTFGDMTLLLFGRKRKYWMQDEKKLRNAFQSLCDGLQAGDKDSYYLECWIRFVAEYGHKENLPVVNMVKWCLNSDKRNSWIDENRKHMDEEFGKKKITLKEMDESKL